MPLVRVPRTLPKILRSAEADRLLGALRTDRDRAMVLAMLLAGLRRCGHWTSWDRVRVTRGPQANSARCS